MFRSGLSTFYLTGLLAAGLLLAAPRPAAGQGSLTEEEKSIISDKCTICHTDARILTADPTAIRPIIEDMKAKSPAFFTDVDTEALGAALEKMLSSPEVALQRKAWGELLAKGEALFSDTSLGTTGKSCASCHTVEKLRGAAGDFPKFDSSLNRHVSLLDKINTMISSNMGGKKLPLGDPRSTALEAYLKSLR